MRVGILVRHTWRLGLLALIGGYSIAGSSIAGTVSLNAAAPSGDILAAQLGNLGPGTHDGGRNFLDNGGPPGQTFKVTSSGLANRFTVKGRGDSSDTWNGGPNAWEGDEIWNIQVALVNGDGSLTPIATDSATGVTAGGATNIADYLTFQLATPVALTAGVQYAFSMYLSDAGGPGTDGGWFGIAHSDTDVYADGVAINNNNSIANPGGNGGAPQRAFPAAGFAAPIPALPGTNGSYDYVFAVQAVPEPATMALLALGCLGLMGLARRRLS